MFVFCQHGLGCFLAQVPSSMKFCESVFSLCVILQSDKDTDKKQISVSCERDSYLKLGSHFGTLPPCWMNISTSRFNSHFTAGYKLLPVCVSSSVDMSCVCVCGSYMSDVRKRPGPSQVDVPVPLSTSSLASLMKQIASSCLIHSHPHPEEQWPGTCNAVTVMTQFLDQLCSIR